ncbi:MAG: hypothetical protein WCC53_01150 [Thermoanaerobaculia bacterium]|jgi:hypothetical protein
MIEAQPELARLRLEQRAKAGANWFYWIAGLSLVNSIAHAAGSTWVLIAGLGITQVFDGVFNNATPAIKVVGILADVAAGSVFIALGYIARTQRAGFVAGLVLYSLDALIFLLFQEWLGLAFHVFVLFSISSGYTAFKVLSSPPPLLPKAPSLTSAPAIQVRPEDLQFRNR